MTLIAPARGASWLFVRCLVIGAPAPAGAVDAPRPSASRVTFDQTDLNGDGFIELAEDKKDATRSRHALDLNGDGYRDATELQSIPDPAALRPLRRRLRHADLDGDGHLSFKEVVEARMATFDQADADRDDRLTLAEVPAAEQARRAARLAAAQASAPDR